MLSSVTAGPPDPIGERDKLVGRQFRNRFRMRNAFRRPDVDGIFASTEASQPVAKAHLLGLQLVETKRPDEAEQIERSLAKILHGIVGEDVGGAEESTVLASHGAPDQGAIAGVEFLDAAIGLDDLGARHRYAPGFGHRERGATACDQAAAAIASGAPADQADDLHAGG